MSKSKKPQSAYEADPKEIARLSYEQAAERLEAILDDIESGEIGLEDAVNAYRLGTALQAHCQSLLDRAEQHIRELTPGERHSVTRDSGDPDLGTAPEMPDENTETAPF